MTNILVTSVGIAALVTMPLVTFSLGLETGGPQFRALFVRGWLPLRYFLATFVVMPAIAIGLGVAGAPRTLWVGLALMSLAPPAPPATRKLRKMGNFDVGLAWQALAFLVAVITIPLTIALVQRMGIASYGLKLTWGPMLVRSLLFFAGPLALGLLTRRYLSPLADRLAKPIALASNVALVILVVLALIVAIPMLVRFDLRTIVSAIAFVAVAILVGHLFGGPGRDTRVTLAAMLATRFPVPALVLAQANGAMKMVLPVVLVYVIAGALLVPLYDRTIDVKQPA